MKMSSRVIYTLIARFECANTGALKTLREINEKTAKFTGTTDFGKLNLEYKNDFEEARHYLKLLNEIKEKH